MEGPTSASICAGEAAVTLEYRVSTGQGSAIEQISAEYGVGIRPAIIKGPYQSGVSTGKTKSDAAARNNVR